MRPINIGLTEAQRCGVIELLNRDLADAYLLLIKVPLGCGGATISHPTRTVARAV